MIALKTAHFASFFFFPDRPLCKQGFSKADILFLCRLSGMSTVELWAFWEQSAAFRCDGYMGKARFGQTFYEAAGFVTRAEVDRLLTDCGQWRFWPSACQSTAQLDSVQLWDKGRKQQSIPDTKTYTSYQSFGKRRKKKTANPLKLCTDWVFFYPVMCKVSGAEPFH